MIPAEAVEAAARAIYATEAQPMYDESKEEFTGARPWEWLTERSWEVYREKARLTLEAAAPYMLANALDQGEMAGSQAHALEEYPHLELTKNPYRPTNAV